MVEEVVHSRIFRKALTVREPSCYYLPCRDSGTWGTDGVEALRGAVKT